MLVVQHVNVFSFFILLLLGSFDLDLASFHKYGILLNLHYQCAFEDDLFRQRRMKRKKKHVKPIMIYLIFKITLRDLWSYTPRIASVSCKMIEFVPKKFLRCQTLMRGTCIRKLYSSQHGYTIVC